METERDFDPETMIRATAADIFRIYKQLYGIRYPYEKVNNAQEADMSRTLNGNLTGRAAHGIDELDVPATDYAVRLDNARARVKELFEDDKYFVMWLMRIPDGTMLEVMENIVAQITRYDEGADAQQAHDWKDEAIAQEADSKDLQETYRSQLP
jgi:hypothetical protein